MIRVAFFFENKIYIYISDIDINVFSINLLMFLHYHLEVQANPKIIEQNKQC